MRDREYRALSLWLGEIPGSLDARPPLTGDLTCDVAVVGAGFTGLWTAYYLKRAQPDLRIAVIEREIAGYGASGRNGGWVSGGIAGSWRVYAQRAGDDAVRRAVEETHRAIDEVGAVAEREGIDCRFDKRGTMTVALSEPQRARLAGDVDRARARGLAERDLRLLEPDELSALPRVSGCLLAAYSPHCATADPARLVRGLADACERAGVALYERSEALDVAPGVVRCAGGAVRADHVLRATESYTTQLPGRRVDFLPLFSSMIATEPLGTDVWEQLGWHERVTVRDHSHLFFYARRTPDDRLAIGSRGGPYRLRSPIDDAAGRDEGVRARVTEVVDRRFRAAAGAEITHHWGGPLAVPRDWCMSVDYDRAQGIGWAGGYGGHGVVASNIAGRTLADLVLGRATDLVTLPWVGHRNRGWRSEPLRFAASQTLARVLSSADRFESRTGRGARRTVLATPFAAAGSL